MLDKRECCALKTGILRSLPSSVAGYCGGRATPQNDINFIETQSRKPVSSALEIKEVKVLGFKPVAAQPSEVHEHGKKESHV